MGRRSCYHAACGIRHILYVERLILENVAVGDIALAVRKYYRDLRQMLCSCSCAVSHLACGG